MLTKGALITGARLVGLSLTALMLLPAPAASAASLSAQRAVERDCATRPFKAGAPGVDRLTWTAPSAGLLTVALEGPPRLRSDWDLGLFDRSGAHAGASTTFGSAEKASVWVDRGDQLVAQGCRRDGPLRSVPISFDLFETGGLDLPLGLDPIQLVSVPIADDGDLSRLESTGLDVTHDVGPSTATLALYTLEERAKLLAAGFTPTTLIGDLGAADRADRRSEARALAAPGASALPSGRETYREYVDYTNEMKAIAEANPGFVRAQIIGTSFERRPIVGLEFAANVNSTGDGRPVYLNMGAHHAREWPSAELPMEFARDLSAGFGSNPRITALLNEVRIVIVPIVNVDGFIASRGYGTSMADDDQSLTLALALNDQAAYKRKNCRPTVPGSEALPCAMRTNSGVDPNRNYGAYWGGTGSSSDVTAQGYRGTAPYSEPETEAVHAFTAKIHPTVFITNHTFTDDGKWLRQPGFDAPFLPADGIGALSPDEAGMKTLGDAMGAATGWTSERGYETLGDITGATEDWNYFAQGTYGYTPEARGLNFHANYADSVVEEYEGDSTHTGRGVRDAFLIAGEFAADPTHHSVISGTGPAGATLRLRKEFETETSQPAVVVDDVLDTVLTVPASGAYEWHVNPSARPLFPGEVWTMTCRRPGQALFTRTVAVARGEQVTENWAGACGADPPSPGPGPGPDPGPGPNPGPDPGPGPGPEPNPDPDPDPGPGGGNGAFCDGVRATMVGTSKADTLQGDAGRDVIVALGGDDRIGGGGGDDLVCAGGGADTVRGNRDDDDLRGGSGDDQLNGGQGTNALRGGPGTDACRRGEPKGC